VGISTEFNADRHEPELGNDGLRKSLLHLRGATLRCGFSAAAGVSGLPRKQSALRLERSIRNAIPKGAPAPAEKTVSSSSFNFSARYQQRPIPLEGEIVRWEWLRLYDELPARKPGDTIVQSWDVA
jgi:hypothetical protein